MFQMGHGRDDGLNDVRIPAGDVMALQNLTQGVGKLLDGRVLISDGDKVDERHRGVAKFRRINQGPITRDDPLVFHASNTFGDSW